LRKILEKLLAKEKISLCFVVPEDIFETFTFQNYHNEEGMVPQKVPESVKMLQQWVLGVPLVKLLSEKEEAGQFKVQDMKKGAANEDDMQQPQTPKKMAANEDNMQQPSTLNKRGGETECRRNISTSNAKKERTKEKGIRSS
jgi:hypothetical protein